MDCSNNCSVSATPLLNLRNRAEFTVYESQTEIGPIDDNQGDFLNKNRNDFKRYEAYCATHCCAT